MDTAFLRFIDALPGFANITGQHRATAQCPAHDDHNPSLSITAIEGSLLLHCHAGCTIEDILAALGLQLKDLYDDPAGARYLYGRGRIVTRTPEKQFRQFGNKADRTLFHVERLIDITDTVYVTEGEKDVLAIEAAGGVAVCSAMGAGKAYQFDWVPLTGHTVIIVADDDTPGMAHAQQVSQLVTPIAESVRIVKAATGKDAADHIAAGHELCELVDITPDPLAKARTFAWIMAQDFPPLEYHIPGIVPEGLGVLAAPPKSGKSWLVLALGIAVAAGGVALGHLRLSHGRPVLYFALEDGWRRLQERGEAINNGDTWKPDNLHCVTDIATDTDTEAFNEVAPMIIEFLHRHRKARPLIVVDTFGRIKPARPPGADVYQHDYHVAVQLKTIVDRCPGASLLMVHHTRKQETADFVDSLSGSYGLPAAADYILALKRKRHSSEAILSVTGRDVTEAEYALSANEGMWTLDGDNLPEAANAAHTRHMLGNLSGRILEILDYVQNREKSTAEGPKSTAKSEKSTVNSAVAEEFGLTSREASVYLNRLVERGLLRKINRGNYTLKDSLVVYVESVDLRAKATDTTETTPPLGEDSPNPADRFTEPEHPPPPSKPPSCTKCGTELIQPDSIARGVCEECHLFPRKPDEP